MTVVSPKGCPPCREIDDISRVSKLRLGDGSAPCDDTRSEATYCHDIRDRAQRAVDRVLVTAQILLTEGAEGFTHQIDLLGTGQRRYAGFTAVAGGQDGTFRLAGYCRRAVRWRATQWLIS